MNKFVEGGIIPRVDLESAADFSAIAKAAYNADIISVELKGLSGKTKDALNAFKSAELLVGVSVLSAEEADFAIKAGADFLTTDKHIPQVLEFASQKGFPLIPFYDGTLADLEKYGVTAVKRNSGDTGAHRGIDIVFTDVQPEKIGIALLGNTYAASTLEIPQKTEDVEGFLKGAMGAALGFKFMHMGINNETREEGEKAANTFGGVFHMPINDMGAAFFAGTEIEALCYRAFGVKGHIGYKVNNIERALAYLKRKGIGTIESTAQKDEEGRLRFIYTDLEVSGFAIHIRQL